MHTNPSADSAALAERYPLTVAAFEHMAALEHLDRVLKLDAAWAAIRSGRPAAPRDDVYSYSAVADPAEYDLIYAGGGLGLLHAAIMARHGFRVLLFDRGEAGCAHREWNISRDELRALVAAGFCSWDELRDVIMAEYDTGVVRFFTPERAAARELWMPEVLNVALDAGALLRLARGKLVLEAEARAISDL
nr:hypothetical protein [Kouleothrix sp.]